VPCTRSRTLGHAAIALLALAACAAAAFAVAPSRPAAAQPPSPTPEPWHLEPIARYGGATHAVAGAGDVLYAGLGARVVALDIGDPAAPVQVGESPVLGGVVQDLMLEGELLYAAWQAGTPDARRGGLAVLGVTEPTEIVLLRQASVDVATRRLAVVDGVALMVGGYDWQSSANIHRGALVPVDPRAAVAPQFGERYAFQNVAQAITVRDRTAYVLEPRAALGFQASIRAFDVDEPQRPQPRTLLAVPGPPKNLVATPSRLYVATGESGLRVVDVALDGGLRERGRVTVPTLCADDVALAPAGLAVLDSCAGRLHLFALGSDGWPVAIGDVAVPAMAGRVLVLGDRVAVTHGERGGVTIIDVRRWDAPFVGGAWSPEGAMGAVEAVAISADGQVLVASHPRAGLTTLSASADRPDDPPRVASHMDIDGFEHIDMLGKVLVAAKPSDGVDTSRVDFVDVGDPDAPRLTASLAVPAPADVIAHPAAPVVYVPSHGRGLHILDATDPAHPELVATLPELSFSSAVRGARGLIASSGSALLTLDIGNPTAPVVIGRSDRLTLLSFATALAATADRAYVTNRTAMCGAAFYCADLLVVDVSDPTQMRMRIAHDLIDETQPQSLAIVGGHLILGGANGLAVADAERLDQAYEPLATYAAPGPVLDVLALSGSADASRIVTAEGDAGLAFYRLAPAAAALPTATGASPLPTARATPTATASPERAGPHRVYLPIAARQSATAPRHSALRITNAIAGATYGIAVGDGLVYRGQGGTISVIEDGPDGPREVGRSTDLQGLVFDLAVDGDLLYAAVSEHGLAVLSLADPRRPVLLGTALTGDAARSVVVSGTVAFVAAGDAGLEVFDVADPSAPRRISRTPVVRRAWRLWLHRDHLYISTPDTGQIGTSVSVPIQIFDVLDPHRPRRVGEIGGPFVNGWSLAFYGDHAYVSHCESCMKVFDVADPPAPVEVADLADQIRPLDIVVDDQHLVVVGSSIEFFDLADPLAPALVSSVPLGERWGRRITARNGLVATAGNKEWYDAEQVGFGNYIGPIELVDASDVDRPRYLGAHWPPFYGAFGLLPSGHPDRFYVLRAEDAPLGASAGAERRGAGHIEEMVQPGPLIPAWAVDISDPDAPRLAERVPVLDDVTEMVVAGTIGYAVRGTTSLAVFDLASPANPVPMANLDLEERLHSVTVADGKVLVRGLTSSGPFDQRTYTATLHVVDVGDPIRPTPRGTLHFSGTGWGSGIGLSVVGSIAWLPLEGALHAIDISDPERPTHVSQLPIPRLNRQLISPFESGRTFLSGVVARGDRLWMGSEQGLYTVNIADAARPRVIGRSGGEVFALWPTTDDRLLGVGCEVTLFNLSGSGPATAIDALSALPSAPIRCGIGSQYALVVGDRLYLLPRSEATPTGLVVVGIGAR